MHSLHRHKTYDLNFEVLPEALHKLSPLCEIFAIKDSNERIAFIKSLDGSVFESADKILDNETMSILVNWLASNSATNPDTAETWSALDLLIACISYYNEVLKKNITNKSDCDKWYQYPYTIDFVCYLFEITPQENQLLKLDGNYFTKDTVKLFPFFQVLVSMSDTEYDRIKEKISPSNKTIFLEIFNCYKLDLAKHTAESIFDFAESNITENTGIERFRELGIRLGES